MTTKTVLRPRYRTGTVVMRRDGTVQVKTKEGWIPEHRLVMEHQLGRELEEGEKVFHLDNTLKGEEEYNDRRNLTVIKCRTTKWINLVKSRVMYIPRKDVTKYKEFVKS